MSMLMKNTVYESHVVRKEMKFYTRTPLTIQRRPAVPVCVNMCAYVWMCVYVCVVSARACVCACVVVSRGRSTCI